MEFELRDALRNSVETTETTAIFHMTIMVGVKGNTYPSFLSDNYLSVVCPKSMTGDEMEAHVAQECMQFVSANFPAI